MIKTQKNNANLAKFGSNLLKVFNRIAVPKTFVKFT